MKSHENLIIWKKSIELTKLTYLQLKNFPADEKFTIVEQMKRAALSVPCNIAEGAGRRSPKEFRKFLIISLGSLAELETQYIIAKELNFIDKIEEPQILIKTIRVMISSLIRKLSE